MAKDSVRSEVDYDLTRHTTSKCARAFIEVLNSMTGSAVILDLRKVNFLDSLGLGLVVNLAKDCEAKQKTFHREVGSRKVMEMSDKMSLGELYDIKLVE
jgi:anti-anti-sigma factor